MSRLPEATLVALDVKPGAALESQSGLQMLRPRIYGALQRSGNGAQVAAIVMHPTSNFMGHYLLGPLARRGISCMGLNSRYVGNDTVLLMERVLQDLGAGVRYLREQGFKKIILVGNSGGAALASFYQAQAENLTAHHFVHGEPTHLHPADLPPVDGIVLCAAHLGRSRLLRDWIDPSVIDENDPVAVDPSLDMYGEALEKPYSPDFLARFHAGQAARLAKIEAWVEDRLRQFRETPAGPQDQAFIIYRTHADPRCLDLSLDASDRRPGSVWGDAREVNFSANAMGRTTSLKAFLSQWSSKSQADGPGNLAQTTVPILLLTYTADQSTFPSTRDAWLAAGGRRIINVDIKGGNHYLAGQPELVHEAADAIHAWTGEAMR
jgi:pimeloyl-ACP methyl ester carboxylesterase